MVARLSARTTESVSNPDRLHSGAESRIVTRLGWLDRISLLLII